MHHTGKRRVAVGFFDGVHPGHRSILRDADRVVTFSRHPAEVLCPSSAPALLMDLDERIRAISDVSPRAEITVLDFDSSLAAVSAEEFASRYLDGCIVRCGDDWRFGAGGRGDGEFLRMRGIEIERVEPAYFRGEKISSSRIRRALSEGDTASASAMLSSPFRVRGRVVGGKGRGAGLGFATVNLETRSLPLRRGVYEVFADCRRAVANYGVAPTMGEEAWEKPVLEVHFIDGGGFSGETLDVEFIRFIRPERKFSGVAELAASIAADRAAVEDARPLLSVVVTTKNESCNIAACARSFAPFAAETELIVVDNRSSDDTKEKAAAEGARVFDFGPERSAQRNFGWRHARADWVIVLDADMILPGETVREMLEKIRDPHRVHDAYWIREIRTGGTWRVKVRNFERSFYDATCIDALRLFSAKVLQSTGGYDENLLAGPEDWDLDLRILGAGFRCALLDGCLYHNEKRLTYSKMLSKKAYYTKSFASYKAKWPGHESVKKQFSVYYRFIGVFFEGGKWRKVLRHPVLFAGVLFERFSVGLVYLLSR